MNRMRMMGIIGAILLVAVGVPAGAIGMLAQPTYTPMPTYTPLPTYTLGPTYTPTSLPTATPYPTQTPYPVLPEAPELLRAEALGTGEVLMIWTVQEGAITYEVDGIPQFEPFPAGMVNPGSMWGMVTGGLEAGTYTVRVRAVGVSTTSPWSEAMTVVVN